MRLPSAGIALFGSLAGWAQAQLVFHDTLIDSVVEEGVRQVTSDFVYENVGDYAVVITSVKTSCGCTVARPEDHVVHPGDLGFLSATMKIDSGKDSSSQSITVRTDDPIDPAHELTIAASIWQPIAVRPASLTWMGENREARVVTIEVNRREPFVIDQVKLPESVEDFGVTTIEPGRLYRLEVKPSETANPGARVDIELTDIGEKAGSVRVIVRGQIQEARRSSAPPRRKGHAYPSIRKPAAPRRTGA